MRGSLYQPNKVTIKDRKNKLYKSQNI